MGPRAESRCHVGIARCWRLSGRIPAGIVPDEVEMGDAAMPNHDDRLESCGYGPDGRLACNTGLFLGYRRSSETPDGPDDWFEISGHARPGDSGGGIFNARGRLVGVLWGTNGEVVVGVQAGRLHILLDSVTPGIRQQSFRPGSEQPTADCPPPTADCPTIDRRDFALLQCPGGACNGTCCPTPPMESQPVESLPEAVVPPLSPFVAEAAGASRDALTSQNAKPMLPWRGNAEKRDADLDARTRRPARCDRSGAPGQARRPAADAVHVEAAERPTRCDDRPSPLLAGLCVLAAILAGFVIYFSTHERLHGGREAPNAHSDPLIPNP